MVRLQPFIPPLRLRERKALRPEEGSVWRAFLRGEAYLNPMHYLRQAGRGEVPDIREVRVLDRGLQFTDHGGREWELRTEDIRKLLLYEYHFTRYDLAAEYSAQDDQYTEWQITSAQGQFNFYVPDDADTPRTRSKIALEQWDHCRLDYFEVEQPAPYRGHNCYESLLLHAYELVRKPGAGDRPAARSAPAQPPPPDPSSIYSHRFSAVDGYPLAALPRPLWEQDGHTTIPTAADHLASSGRLTFAPDGITVKLIGHEPRTVTYLEMHDLCINCISIYQFPDYREASARYTTHVEVSWQLEGESFRYIFDRNRAAEDIFLRMDIERWTGGKFRPQPQKDSFNEVTSSHYESRRREVHRLVLP